MRPGLLLLLITAFAACSEGPTHSLEGELYLQPPDALLFPSTPVGGETVRQLRAVNTSKFEVELALRVDPPFAIEGPVRVAAGGEALLDVHFRPTEVGDFQRTLEVNGLTVALKGQARETCAPQTCANLKVDPNDGACLAIAVEDGAPCTNTCMPNGTCLGGLCRGPAVSCDDGDACTADACDPNTGCAHAPVVCPAPDDPCLAAACDPQQGCITQTVTDGTACGPSDCTSANVCISGSCVVRPVPEGASCGEASPCQPQGTCRSQVCERPAPTVLTPTWEWSGPGEIYASPAIDTTGTLFVRSIGSGWSQGLLTALGRDGALRFEVSDPHRAYTAPMIVGTHLIGLSHGSVVAVDAASGAEVWNTSVLSALMGVVNYSFSGDARVLLLDHSIAQIAPGEVAVVFRVEEGPLSSATVRLWWLVLDATTGAALRAAEHSGSAAQDLVSDGNGHHSFGYADPVSATWRWKAIDDQGATRWDMPGLVTGAVMAPQGMISTLYDGACGPGASSLMAREPANGLVSFNARAAIPHNDGLFRSSPTLRAFDGALLVAGYWKDPVQCTYEPGEYLMRVDPTSGDVLWAQPVFSQGLSGELVPTRTGSLLFVDAELVGTTRREFLRELNLDGEERWRCELPSGHLGIAAVHEGRLFTRSQNGIAAFDVPSAKLAAQGWVTEFGDPQHRRIPR